MSRVRRVLLLVAPLVAACSGSDRDYRVTVDLGPAIRAVASDDLDESSSGADRIVSVGADALPALAVALRTEPPAVRRGVAEVVGRIDDARAVPILITTAADPDADVRYEAIVALGMRTAPDARSVVESALDDRDPKVRRGAASACVAHCASRAALGRLVELAMNDDPPPNVLAARSAVVRILGGPDAERAELLRVVIRAETPPALERPGGGDATVRAALLASDVGSPAGRDVLAAAALDGAPVVRLQAIHALGTVGDATAVGVLARIDGQPTFGEYACDALRRLNSRGVDGANEALDGWRGACPAAALPPPPGAR